jgi:MFS family permease
LVLKADLDFVFYSFSLTVITAPCLGAVVGGLVTTKFLGSYKNDNALVLCFFVYLMFAAACIPCPFLDDYLAFIIVLWVAVFMQGFIEPIMMGIILSSVTEIERPAASSISIMLEILFGMFPASYIYSLVYDSTKKLDDKGVNISRGGMYTLFFSVFVGLIALVVALPLRKRSL